jgi:hypothetical protein
MGSADAHTGLGVCTPDVNIGRSVPEGGCFPILAGAPTASTPRAPRPRLAVDRLAAVWFRQLLCYACPGVVVGWVALVSAPTDRRSV